MKSAKMTRAEAILKIADLAREEGVTLTNFRPKLETLFPKKAIDFDLVGGGGYFRIDSPDGGKPILVASAGACEPDEDDVVVGSMVIG